MEGLPGCCSNVGIAHDHHLIAGMVKIVRGNSSAN